MKKIIWYVLDTLRISDVIQLRMSSYLRDNGWFRSFYKKESVDKNNNPIPWCSYPFISFLEPRLKDTHSVFEFGSGNSTLWFSKRAKLVVSLEHDKEWYEKLQKNVPSNVQFVYKELSKNGEYANYINTTNLKFDLVLVDGRDRVNCAKNSINSLSESGVLVFDNSNVECYSEAMEFLKDKGFKRLDFYGISPITTISTCTTIFYKSNNCLEI